MHAPPGPVGTAAGAKALVNQSKWRERECRRTNEGSRRITQKDGLDGESKENNSKDTAVLAPKSAATQEHEVGTCREKAQRSHNVRTPKIASEDNVEAM